MTEPNTINLLRFEETVSVLDSLVGLLKHKQMLLNLRAGAIITIDKQEIVKSPLVRDRIENELKEVDKLLEIQLDYVFVYLYEGSEKRHPLLDFPYSRITNLAIQTFGKMKGL